MDNFSKIEPAYLSKEGCRLIWNAGKDDQQQHVVLLNKEDLKQLVEILKNNNAGKVKLGDSFSEILVNSDVVQFRLKNKDQLDAQTSSGTNQ